MKYYWARLSSLFSFFHYLQLTILVNGASLHEGVRRDESEPNRFRRHFSLLAVHGIPFDVQRVEAATTPNSPTVSRESPSRTGSFSKSQMFSEIHAATTEKISTTLPLPQDDVPSTTPISIIAPHPILSPRIDITGQRCPRRSFRMEQSPNIARE